jgi:hypothetical protein
VLFDRLIDDALPGQGPRDSGQVGRMEFWRTTGDVARPGHARFLDLDREPLLFELPPLPPGEWWLRLVDTALAPPDDLADPPSPLPPDHNEYWLEARSSVILIAGRA